MKLYMVLSLFNKKFFPFFYLPDFLFLLFLNIMFLWEESYENENS